MNRNGLYSTVGDIEKALNDLNSTARLVRFLAKTSCKAVADGENEDPNLWCVFEVIADRLDAVDEVLEPVARMLEAPEKAGPRLVDNGGAS